MKLSVGVNLIGKGLNQRRISTAGFSLFFAWLLAFPFEGQVLNILAEEALAEGADLNSVTIFAHFIGLFSSGFFIKRQFAAKMTMILSTVVCMAGSLIFFLPFSILWYIALVAMAFFAGLVVASWGFYFKSYSPPEQRLKTAADVLILSNIIMILANVLAVTISAYLSLGFLIIILLGALLITFRLEASPSEKLTKIVAGSQQGLTTILKPLAFLCVFIVIITINSGLMYQVVTPAFGEYQLLASYFWAVPYIVALLILRSLSPKINKAYILYVAMIMIGLSFVAFMLLDTSVISYLIINTLMLGAFGVCDLFWWSILGSTFDYADNPAQILGIGLSMNVLGIIIGGVIGNQINAMENGPFYTAVIALVVLFAVMILLPLLNVQLTRLLKNHPFIIEFASMVESEQDQALVFFKENKQLTDKESEVVKLLLRGYTYKAMSENLFISENTLKYHIKNIYQKLNINSKMELIKIFTDSQK